MAEILSPVYRYTLVCDSFKSLSSRKGFLMHGKERQAAPCFCVLQSEFGLVVPVTWLFSEEIFSRLKSLLAFIVLRGLQR